MAFKKLVTCIVLLTFFCSTNYANENISQSTEAEVESNLIKYYSIPEQFSSKFSQYLYSKKLYQIFKKFNTVIDYVSSNYESSFYDTSNFTLLENDSALSKDVIYHSEDPKQPTKFINLSF